MSDRSRRLVGAADKEAWARGIHAGMTVAHAQAVASGLTVVDADPEGDLAALQKLAACCIRCSPMVAMDPPDGIVIDMPPRNQRPWPLTPIHALISG